MRQGRRTFGVVERGADEDEAREDERERSEAEGEGGGDPQGVVNAGPDVAVAGGEQGRGTEGARQLGGAADDDTQVAGAAATASDGVGTHLRRG